MTDEDWLRKLDEEIWERRTSTGRHPFRYSVEARPLESAEVQRLEEVLERHRGEWVYEPGPGVFGFGVSLSVYVPPTYPGVPAERIFSVAISHVFEETNIHTRDRDYAWVEKYTHTDRNRELRAVFGFREPLRAMHHYDY